MATPHFSYSSEEPTRSERPRIEVTAADAPIVTEIEARFRASDFGNGWGQYWEAITSLTDGQPTGKFSLTHGTEKANNKGVSTEAYQISLDHLHGLIEMLTVFQTALHSLDIDTGGPPNAPQE